jgi:hypothetical protein
LSIDTSGGSPIVQVIGSSGAISNAGLIDIQGATTFSSDAIANSGTIKVDATQTLTLKHTGISGGTIDDQGTIDVRGSSSINGVNLTGGQITVESGKRLTLDDTLITNSTITDIGSVNVNGGKTLSLSGVTLTGGLLAFGMSQAKAQAADGGKVALSGVTLLDLVRGDNPNVTVTITASSGLLYAPSSLPPGVTVTNNGTGTIEVTGLLADINTALNNGLLYAPGAAGPNTLTLTADDAPLGDTASKTVSIDTSSGSPIVQVVGSSGAIGNAGLVDIKGSTTFSSDSIINNGTIKVDPNQTLTLKHTGIAGGVIDDQGKIDVEGSNALHGVGITNAVAALIQVEASSALLLDKGTTITGGTLSILGLGLLHIEYGAAGLGATLDHVSVNNSGTIQVDIAAIVPSVTPTTTLVLTNGTTIAGGVISVGNTGVINATAGSNAISGATLTINIGGILETTGGTLTIDAASTVYNYGTLEVNGGNLIVNANVSGGGSATISGGGMLDLGGADAQTVKFNGAGTLQLDNSQSYTGTISSFGAGDVVDLQDITFTGTETAIWTQNSISGGTLRISNGAQTLDLNLAGTYTQDNFALERDSTSHTEVVFSPTHIALSGLNPDGNAIQGQSITVTPSGPNLTNFSYTWLVGGTVVSEVTANTYTPLEADEGKSLQVLITFTDPFTHVAEHVTEIAGTVQATAPVITGTPGMASATGAGPGINLVANGGFETRDFTGWTNSGNPGFTGVSSGGHGGSFSAYFGPIGSDGLLSQNISTTAGQHYTLDFWLSNGGGPANDFSVSWNGTPLLSYLNVGPQGYTEHTFDVVATAASTPLQFAFRQDPSFWHLDDISVTSTGSTTTGANGTITFVDPNDTHTVSFTPAGQNYLGTFSVDPVNEVAGSVDWHFSTTGAESQQFFHTLTGHPISQSYDVAISEGHPGGTVVQRVGFSAGSSANDTFVFAPGMGQEMVFNYSHQAGNTDHIELDHFSGVGDFSNLILQSVHNNQDTLINLGHNDSLLLVGISVSNLHANDFTIHA